MTIGRPLPTEGTAVAAVGAQVVRVWSRDGARAAERAAERTAAAWRDRHDPNTSGPERSKQFGRVHYRRSPYQGISE